ncbi:MAG TPA: PAS domain S-box protein [Candidatus Omnitrophota bacterium]|nr:PAS domain S-box protein [Candidatus Omnitrophota bacterium]HPD84737.1 PAS domain S-box protein [Candidatus Omnitrophota bacterium]HRZ03595.1 PAS domain S-box protein [Candidatus Omnitrophota bacterium]
MFFSKKKIQTRLILLSIVMTILFAGMILFQVRITQERLGVFIDGSVEEKKIIFNTLLELKGESLATVANDYTYWDEMVTFAGSGDKTWAKENLDTAFATYKFNTLWVYGKDLSRVYANNDLGLEDVLEVPFPKSKELFTGLFKEKGLCHFFVDTPHGLLEIRGATIHYTADSQRNKPAEGYLFAGRFWNEDYIGELSKLISGVVLLGPVDQTKPAPAVAKSKSDRIFLAETLYGWDGKSVRLLKVEIVVPLMKDIFIGFRWGLIIQIVSLLIILLALLVSLHFWVNAPLRAISRTLQKDDISYLDKLQKQGGEFSDIAKLIIQFMQQRQQLIADMAERKEMEETLRVSEERLRQIAITSRDWIWEVDAEGRYIYSSASVQELLGYSSEEVIGKYFYEFFSPEEKEVLETQAKENFSQRMIFYGFENKNIRKDGRIVTLETTAVPIVDSQGNFMGYRGVDRDITERKKAENEIKKSVEDLTQFKRLTIDREQKMVDLKKEINRLSKELGRGEPYVIPS